MKGKQINPNGSVPVDASQVAAIEIERIVPSSFETQTRRRARFKTEEIVSLGASFQKHGVRQPILVRPVYPNFEIVFGERRFLAAKSIDLPKINCFIDNLTDEEVLELQYEENHRRQENSPLDDAFLFNFLMEKYGYSEEQLADRLGTSRRNVVEKLKLNHLIDEAKEELEAGKLPLRHAYFMATLAIASQMEIVRSKYAYKYYDREEKPVSFTEFKKELDENILHRLKNAPFNIGDPRLHIKGLICVRCPEQTNFENFLFPEYNGDARCLNSTCFKLKTDTHLKLQREAIALKMPNPENAPFEELVKTVPLVTERSYAPERTPFKEKITTNVAHTPQPECEFSVMSLAAGGERKGEEVYICREKGCPVHDPQSSEPSEEEIERRENYSKSEVDRSIRRQVLQAATEWFDDYKPFWQFDDLIKDLIFNFLKITKFTHDQDFLFFIRDWKDAPKNYTDMAKLKAFVDGLDKRRQSQLLFLMANFGELPASRSGNDDQSGIRAVAKDYTKLDFDRAMEDIREQMK